MKEGRGNVQNGLLQQQACSQCATLFYLTHTQGEARERENERERGPESEREREKILGVSSSTSIPSLAFPLLSKHSLSELRRANPKVAWPSSPSLRWKTALNDCVLSQALRAAMCLLILD